MEIAADLKDLMLRRPRWTLAVAESLTAGHVQAAVAAVPGASGYFLGGLTAYTLAQKVRLLGVNRPHARSVDCVSPRVAAEMAVGAAELFGADLAVATTGYAGPVPAQRVPAPYAYWALCHRRRGGVELVSGRVELAAAGRTEVQERVAGVVLAELVAYLRRVRTGPTGARRGRR